MDKETFVKIAEGFIKGNKYDIDTYNAILRVAKKHKVDTDFIGVTSGFSPLSNAVLEAIAIFDPDDWFQYFVYDCDGSFDKFNSKVENPNGTHPDIASLEDLYDFITKPYNDFIEG